MSLDTWKAEFYPVDAKEVPKEEALAHSLRKWQGLRPAAMQKHGVWCGAGGGEITENGFNGLPVSSSSCALCVAWREDMCALCPLEAVRGMKCDEPKMPEGPSPYRAWTRGADPEPMIALIEKAIAAQGGAELEQLRRDAARWAVVRDRARWGGWVTTKQDGGVDVRMWTLAFVGDRVGGIAWDVDAVLHANKESARGGGAA